MPFQSGGQVLGEERLHLLPVRLGLGRIGGIHAAEGTGRSGHAGEAVARAPREADGGGADERAVGAEAGRDDAGAARRTRGGRARSSSAWAAAKNGVAEAEGHRAGDDREPQVEQVGHRRHRPADQACRCARRSLGRRLRGRAPGGGRDGRARRLGLEAARGRRTRTRRPSGSTMTWPMWPALPPAPSSSRPSSTMPPPTPVDTTMARKFALARRPRRPSPRRGRAPWRRCRRRRRQPGRARPAGPAAGSRARPGC